MSGNPFLKAYNAVSRNVYRNKAKLVVVTRLKRYDAQSGAVHDEKTSAECDIYASSVSAVSDFVVDEKQFMKGDLTMTVPFMRIKKACLMFGRNAHSSTCGIDATSDMIIMNGETFRIVSVSPSQYFRGEPSKVKFQLRKI